VLDIGVVVDADIAAVGSFGELESLVVDDTTAVPPLVELLMVFGALPLIARGAVGLETLLNDGCDCCSCCCGGGGGGCCGGCGDGDSDGVGEAGSIGLGVEGGGERKVSKLSSSSR